MTKPPTDFFTQDAAKSYDDRNRKLSDISNCLHFLTGLLLKELPDQSRILCVGVGTGAEILSLSQTYPNWKFLALDPSQSMLNICRERLQQAGVADRCEFVHGYVQDLPPGENFNAALSILLAHFVPKNDRQSFFQNMTDRLKPRGFLVNAEISFDLDSREFSSMLPNWMSVQQLMGATAESLAKLPSLMRDVLTIFPPKETENIFREVGIDLPVQFFQAFMICGWYGQKKK